MVLINNGKCPHSIFLKNQDYSLFSFFHFKPLVFSNLMRDLLIIGESYIDVCSYFIDLKMLSIFHFSLNIEEFIGTQMILCLMIIFDIVY